MKKSMVFAIAFAGIALAQAPSDPATLRPEVVAWLNQAYDRAHPPSLVGKTLPKVDGLDVAGHERTIAVFMMSTCPHCQKELPYLSKLDTAARQSGKAAVVPVFFARDKGAGAFLQPWPSSAPAYIGEADDLRIAGTPTTLVIDKSGKVLQAFVGELKPADEEALLKLVSE